MKKDNENTGTNTKTNILGGFRQMLIPTIIIGVLAVVLTIIAYMRGEGEHILGLKAAGTLLLQILPLLIFAFILAGMIQYLVPTETIAKWVGTESGMKGVFIGTAIGCVMPGGPYILLPVAAGMLRVGAGVGTMVALLTAWSVIGVSRLPMEIGLLGWKFSLIRIACTFFFPPIAGFIANKLFSNVNLL